MLYVAHQTGVTCNLNASIADSQLSTKDMMICNVVLSCSGIYARSRFSPERLQNLQSSPSR
jgi:hypothetical protein